MESRITAKGQATIPSAIRKQLGVRPGDHVKFFVHPDGTVVILPKLAPSIMKGMLARRRRAVSIKHMNDAIASEASARAAPRSRGRK